MKKLYNIIAGLFGLILTTSLFSCSNDLNLNTKNENNAFSSSNNSISSRAITLNPTVNLTVYLFGVDPKCTKPGVWAWAKASADTNYSTAGWPGDFEMESDNTTGYDGYKYTFKIDPTYDLGILFNNVSGGKPQTSDIIIPKEHIASDTTLYFNWNSMAYYYSVDDCVGIMGASIIDMNSTNGTATVRCKTSLLSDADITKDISVKDSNDTVFTVESAVIKSDVLTIQIKEKAGSKVSNAPYTVIYGGKEIVASASTELIENLYGKNAVNIDDFGLTFVGNKAWFKTWAPTASAASVLLYDTAANAYDASKTDGYDGPGTTEKDYKVESYEPKEVEMFFDTGSGFWVAVNVDVSGFKYYKYKLTIDGKPYYVADIWHNIAGADSNASQIATIDDPETKPAGWEETYTNPFGSSGTETKTYNDAVIYEMHIRDWSRAVVSDSTGKFLDIANSTEIMNHLKDLGVTHVQILPMFDYAQINSNKSYNWGYNPYHYNVPEGRYVTDGYTDGTQAVKEMRAMIKAFHDNGIAVIMDVVYNHTSSTKTGSLYDTTVPQYFYSVDDSGTYFSGSGCGNNVDTRHVMVRKYVIDSLVHWVKNYHINGFRFDLMGCIDKETMKEVYDTLYALDKNILVYGEPWTGGTTGFDSSDESTSAGKGTEGYGYGAFDDDFRDAVKGGEFGGFKLGQVQGTFSDNIETGLVGDVISSNKRNPTGITGLALHYAECHDNFTLFDKLVYSTIAPLSGDAFADKFDAAYKAVMADEAKLKTIKKEQILAGAYILLSQGTPFLNGGQEFLRTKKGDPDSYSADTKGGIKWTTRYGKDGSYVAATDIDDVNTIDLNMKTTYADVYNIYKGLIALRKNHAAFRNATSATATKIKKGITLYTVTGDNETFDVIFNATDSAYTSVKLNGSSFGVGIQDFEVAFEIAKGKVVSIDETNGSVTIADTATAVTNVPAKSFVILKK